MEVSYLYKCTHNAFNIFYVGVKKFKM